jgi:hypothetical protein
LVSTEPCASSTAAETMFSEAISSICSCSRRSSSAIAAASSGSRSARRAVKNPSITGTTAGCVIVDLF